VDKEKIILTDCDGVLCDWNLGLNKFMIKRGYPQLPNTDTEYSIAVRHGITQKQAQDYIKEFNQSSFISDLEPFADSVEYVKKLSDCGFRFIIVTSISDHPDAKIYRTQNVEKLFGKVFDNIVCLQMGASKAHMLSTWADSGYFWIEDHMRQAEAGYEAGLKTVLINHPYNFHYSTDLFPTVSYITPWKEIFNMVCKEYNIINK